MTVESAAKRPPHAIVVGASQAGLMTALLLSRAGTTVTLIERSDDASRRGAVLSVGDNFLERVTGRTDLGEDFLAHGIQMWGVVHSALMRLAVEDPGIAIVHETYVSELGQDDEGVWAISSKGRKFTGDFLVGADGYRSVVRKVVAPDKPDAAYAGYVLWLGMVDEETLAPRSEWPKYGAENVDHLGGREGYFFLGWALPGHDGTLEPGKRQLGWAWYDATRNDLFRDLGCLNGDVVRRSLAREEIPREPLNELVDEAERWPTIWRDAVRDSIKRGEVLAAPVAEYLPERLRSGRIVLVGDAAHVPTPKTGNGFPASLQDGEALAEAIREVVAGRSSIESALEAYEQVRLTPVRELVASGQAWSREFSARVQQNPETVNMVFEPALDAEAVNA